MRVSDPLPSQLTYVSSVDACVPDAGGVVSCPALSTLASGAQATFRFTVKLNASYTGDGADIVNTAAVSSDTPDPDLTNNRSPGNGGPGGGVLPVAPPSADLTTIKTAPAALIAGAPAVWTITVTNAGLSDAAAVVVTDTLPAGLSYVSSAPAICSATGQDVTCPAGTVPAGTAVSVAVTTLVAANVAPGAVLANSATTTSSTPDPDPTNNDSGPVPGPPATASANLSTTKTAPTQMIAGLPAVWTITVSNAGPSDAAAVVATDTLPARLTYDSSTPSICTASGQVVTCAVGTIASGASAAIQVSTLVAANVPAGTVLRNSASATSSTPDPKPEDNTSGPVPAPPVTTSANLTTTKVAPTAVVAGSPAVWTITVANSGPSDAADVVVTDTLPTGLSYVSSAPDVCTVAGQVVTCAAGTVPAGTSVNVAVTTLVAANVAPGTVLRNSATATSSTPDPTPEENTSPPVPAPPVTASADLSTTKTAPKAIVAGADAVWLITVANKGPSDAAAVVVTDTLPAGLTYVSSDPAICTATGQAVSCAVGTVGAGATASVGVTTRVASDIAPGTVLSNAASVASPTSDPTPGNNDSGPVPAPPAQASADLSTTKEAVDLPVGGVVPGTTYDYIVTVRNNGPSDTAAASVSMRDPLPAQLAFVSSVDGCTASAARVVTCAPIGSLAAGDEA